MWPGLRRVGNVADIPGIRREASRMSLDTAKNWARYALRSPAAQRDVLQLFERATADGVEATVIAAPELTVRGTGYLARWTGSELIVLGLSAGQQQSLGVRPSALFQQLEPRTSIPEIPAQPWVTVSDITLNAGDGQDCFQPLTGTCRYAVDEGENRFLSRCAVRANFFRPDLPRTITAFSFVDAASLPRQGKLGFRFIPITSAAQPVRIRGTVVVFIQLCTASDWARQQDCQRISNVTATAVEFQ